MKPIIVTVTGPSTAGKTVLSDALAEHGFQPLVSTTTRRPRVGEVNGVQYHFVKQDEFKKLLREDGLIEDVEYNGQFYGVTAAEVQRASDLGKPAVLVAEPHGTQQIYDYCTARGWTVVRVFVNNPIPVLLNRILRRFHADVEGIDLTTDEGQQSYQEVITTHASRIEKILGQEQEEWVKPAYDGTVKYDLVFDEFGDNNQDQVIAATCAHVDTLASNAHQRRPKR